MVLFISNFVNSIANRLSQHMKRNDFAIKLPPALSSYFKVYVYQQQTAQCLEERISFGVWGGGGGGEES